DYSSAKECFRTAVMLAEAHLEKDQSPKSQSQLGGHLNGLANLLMTVDEDEQALQMFEEAIRYQKKAFDAEPRVMQFRAYLANHYLGLGQLYVKLADPISAAKQFELRLVLLPGSARESYRTSRAIAVCVLLTENEELKSMFAKRAVELLNMAIKQGLDPSVDLAKDEAFNSVKDREDFRSLVSSRLTSRSHSQ
ncbi:unnamed protein product, partial [marine sediment metagenome]